MRRRWTGARVRAGLAGMAIIAGGCVGPDAARDVAGAQQRTITALSQRYAGDLALLGDLLERALAARRVIILGGLHREILARGYITADFGADTGRLGSDLADASAASAIVDEVRLGRMTHAQAEAFILDYSLSLRMSDGGASRDAMLARMDAVASHDAGAAALREALAAHVAGVARLLEDADANARAIAEFAAFERDGGGYVERTILGLWERAVVSEMDDPARREAATRLLERVLGLFEERNDG